MNTDEISKRLHPGLDLDDSLLGPARFCGISDSKLELYVWHEQRDLRVGEMLRSGLMVREAVERRRG